MQPFTQPQGGPAHQFAPPADQGQPFQAQPYQPQPYEGQAYYAPQAVPPNPQAMYQPPPPYGYPSAAPQDQVYIPTQQPMYGQPPMQVPLVLAPPTPDKTPVPCCCCEPDARTVATIINILDLFSVFGFPITIPLFICALLSLYSVQTFKMKDIRKVYLAVKILNTCVMFIYNIAFAGARGDPIILFSSVIGALIALYLAFVFKTANEHLDKVPEPVN
eukprot:TRINITY_DN7425_c0_g1_i3.p1 TRINITY_DN7425_c0_g1~~TRINITY_DN7425_c0_g1_i3.p1  ORF type:complete len:218 (+),score=37.11 TRINITY_DN7425_c0_g1_i3:167-820(+)